MSTEPGRLKRFIKAAAGPLGGQIAILVLAVPIIYLFGFREMRFFLVPSGSMEPTLYRQDYLMTLNKDEYAPGDVVVLRDPQDPKSYVVKRLIATGGESVAVQNGAVYVNGRYISEPYILSPPQYDMDEIAVPQDEVFVLGDNRNNSEDSHAWPKATVPRNWIVGKVRFIYFPYARFGAVKGYPLLRSPQSESQSEQDVSAAAM